MADDPKPQSPDTPTGKNDPTPGGQPAGQSPSAISPAPADADGGKPGDKPAGQPPAPNAASKVQADALSDGTVPTVLTQGSSHRSVPKGKASLTAIYRKADIMTTLITFAGVTVAAVIIFGAYAYLTRNQAKPVAAPGKTTTLSSSDLSKLGSFFNGNSAGEPSEVLTVESASLFKNRVAVDSDLKVTGGVSVTGPTALGALTVDQTSTLGVTNVRGQLTVTGPLTLQSPATLAAGATVTGNLTASGNGSFGGSVSAGVINASTISVSGTLNLNGHLSVGGPASSASGTDGVTSGVSLSGNDTAGTVTGTLVPTAGEPSGAALITVNFHAAFAAIPVVVITPVGRNSATLQPFVQPSANGFTIEATAVPANTAATNVSFNYWVVQY